LALDPDKIQSHVSFFLGSKNVGEHVTAGGGVFLSINGGETWKNTFGPSHHVYDVTMDPRNPKIIYNCGFEVGAWRSANQGQTWKRISWI
jgi:hypothetical protein